MRFSTILTSLALGASLWLGSAQAQGRENTRQDEVLLSMAQAYRQHDTRKLSALLPQAKGHVLEPWAAYWELSARLDTAGTQEIQDFLVRWAGSYQEDRLRNDWLLQLGRNRDWAAFNREYPLYRMGDDRSVKCYALLSDFLGKGSDVAGAVAELWLAQREADEACAAAAAALLDARRLPEQTAWLRARLGMENDRLGVATQAAGLLREGWNKTLNAIYLNPGKYLNDKLTALRPQTREFVSLALIRQAYLEPADAAEEIDKLRWKAQLTQEERSWIWGAIGKRAAQKHQPEALAYFARGQFSQMHEDHLVWAARAALRAGQWAVVQQAIDAMPAALRSEPAWVYWRARALMSHSPTDSPRAEAQRALSSIAGPRGFYEQLALEDLGGRISVPDRPAPLSAEEKEAARQNPGLLRALYAIQIGLRSEGVREWNYSTNLHQRGGMDDRGLLAAADLACRHEVWDRCINTSERTRTAFDIDQRFPLPFRAAVVARAQAIALDPAYVYGLMRQESRFVMDARSGVGASGLMQIMPATARWTARKIGLANFQVAQLAERETNIAIGTAYLKLVLDSFGGSLPMAAAAYNAGPSRVRVWRGQGGAPVLDAAVWAENIPFNETRDYVKKVLANTTVYAAMLSGQPQSLKARLGSVGPLDASLPDTAADLP